MKAKLQTVDRPLEVKLRRESTVFVSENNTKAVCNFEYVPNMSVVTHDLRYVAECEPG